MLSRVGSPPVAATSGAVRSQIASSSLRGICPQEAEVMVGDLYQYGATVRAAGQSISVRPFALSPGLSKRDTDGGGVRRARIDARRVRGAGYPGVTHMRPGMMPGMSMPTNTEEVEEKKEEFNTKFNEFIDDHLNP